ncbi:MAG TPA: nuclear transport factor 2 family protein, partial [Pyrinomonadaceae bacterium]|nr:nuclear transport factor 2 family protein [Pyrinomonadaceae bacterium]
MKFKGALFLVILGAFCLAAASCSNSANANRGNRPAQNAANEPSVNTSPTPTPTPDSSVEEITQLINNLASALARNDADALDGIYSDGCVFVAGNGQITTKPEQLVMIKSGDIRFGKVSFEEISVRGYGNAAVAVAHALSNGSFNGKPQTLEERVTFVAVKENKTWRVVNMQSTAITGT